MVRIPSVPQTEHGAAAAPFVRARPRLLRLAYRMTGSYADAEDIVQEVWLRWAGAGHPALDNPTGYFATIATRLCLDRLKSAARQRERYVGTWLPEPVMADWAAADELAAVEHRVDISYAILRLLEQLSPLERAAYLLHDLFDISFQEIATALERSPATCRKLASRARRQLAAAEPRYLPSAGDVERLLSAFLSAQESGQISGLADLLAEDVVFYSDGGGKALAALNPIRGRDSVSRFVLGIFSKMAEVGPQEMAPALVNGAPGFLYFGGDGSRQPFALDLDQAGRIAGFYVVRNPDKLSSLPPAGEQ